MNSFPFHVGTWDIVSKPNAAQTFIRPEAIASHPAWKQRPPGAPPPLDPLVRFRAQAQVVDRHDPRHELAGEVVREVGSHASVDYGELQLRGVLPPIVR